jgi:hypothetical protein
MNLDSVRNLLSAEPFQPIEFRLANGDRHQVVDPFKVAVGKNVVMIGYSDSDRIAWCTPHQIMSIEKLVDMAPGKNGRHQ